MNIFWHFKQLYLSIKTRGCRGDMHFIVYHCFRVWKLYEYRHTDKYADCFEGELCNPITGSIYEIKDGKIIGIKKLK